MHSVIRPSAHPSLHQPELHEIDRGTGQITCGRKPRDAAHVPDEPDLLDSHRGDAGSGADDEDRTARSSTIGDEFPEEGIHRILRERVHTHGCRDQRHIVDDRAQETQQQDDDVLPTDRTIKPSGKRLENFGVFERGDRKENANEKQERRKVDPAQGVRQRQFLPNLGWLSLVEDFTDKPEGTKAEQNAHEWR